MLQKKNAQNNKKLERLESAYCTHERVVGTNSGIWEFFKSGKLWHQRTIQENFPDACDHHGCPCWNG